MSYEEKIIAPTDRQEAIRNKLETMRQEHRTEERELTPTPEQKEILEATIAGVEHVVRRFSGEPQPVSLDDIFLRNKGSIEKESDNRNRQGSYRMLSQTIHVEALPDPVLLSLTAAHELFHYHSYRVLQARNGEDITSYRGGISFMDRSGENPHLNSINEAITAELTYQFFLKQPQLEEIRKESDTIRRWLLAFSQNTVSESHREKFERFFKNIYFFPNAKLAIKKIHSTSSANPDSLYECIGYLEGLWGKEFLGLRDYARERQEERVEFQKLVQQMVDASPDTLNHKIIIQAFCRAYFSGKGEIGKLVDSALGAGAFKKMVEESVQSMVGTSEKE